MEMGDDLLCDAIVASYAGIAKVLDYVIDCLECDSWVCWSWVCVVFNKVG
jgi:hypothetical protein